MWVGLREGGECCTGGREVGVVTVVVVGGKGGCFVGSGRSTPSRGLNAGVIKEQLQGCMDTRQSRPNEVSIGRIGAHAWTKAS